MQRHERVLKLHRLLSCARRPVSRARLMDELACSEATVYRVIADLRDGFGAPVLFHDGAGYSYAKESERFELPGLWFTSAELYGLLAAYQLLSQLESGVIGDVLDSLRERIRSALDLGSREKLTRLRRIRILGIGQRWPASQRLSLAAQAVLARHRIRIAYRSRTKNEHTQRTVSPQRLTHYRDNWYLDALCHARNALRVFAVDRIEEMELLEEVATDIPEAELDRYLAGSYGIFSGEPTHEAKLLFKPERARWVAEENWHPEQSVRWLEDGRFELNVPYCQDEELLQDILKYGPDVEVVAPAALRQRVVERLEKSVATYKATTCS